MGRVLPILVALLCPLLLIWICIHCHRPAIQQDIQQRTEAALVAQALPAGLAQATDRDIVLTGSVASASERDLAEATAREVWGVRRVRNQLQLATVGPGSPESTSSAAGAAGQTSDVDPTTDSDALSFSRRGPALELAGAVPTDERRRQLVSQAGQVWEPQRITDRLRVVPAVDASTWPASFLPLLTALANGRGDLALTVDGSSLQVHGEVLSELAKERLLGSLSTALPGFELVAGQLALKEAETDRERLQARLDAQLQGKIVEFSTGSDQLTARGRSVLDEVLPLLAELRQAMEISGHTDSQGDPGFNRDLSLRRAQTVRAYLMDRGVDGQFLTAAGYGPDRPIADNSTAEGRQRNRRSEFRVLEEG